MIWFAEFQAGKLAQFDPKEERFKEFTLPGPTRDALRASASIPSARSGTRRSGWT